MPSYNVLDGNEGFKRFKVNGSGTNDDPYIPVMSVKVDPDVTSVTGWSTPLSDANVPSEKIVKETIDNQEITAASFNTADGVLTLTKTDGNITVDLDGRYLTTITSIDADVVTVSNLEVDNFKASAIVTQAEGIPNNDNDTTIPTSAAVKDYVDNTVIPDTNTYVTSASFNTGDGVLTLTLNDASTVTVDLDGRFLQNVVGDTTPQLGGDLDLNSNDITGTGNINITGSGTISGDLAVDTNTLKVDSTNNRVGIGTASPNQKFELNDGAMLLQNGQTNFGVDGRITLSSSLVSNEVHGQGGSSPLADVGFLRLSAGGGTNLGEKSAIDLYGYNSNLITMSTSGNERLVIDENGQVGINVTNPGEQLDVSGNVQADNFIGGLRGEVQFKAKAGEALSKGDPVYISGFDVTGNTPIVGIADANDSAKMPAFGLAESTVSLNASVNVVTFGTLSGLDTSSFSLGDVLYVSDTGTLTNTRPKGESSLIQNIGKVQRVHASAGSIKVGGAGRTNDVPNLNDGNVFIGDATNCAVARALTLDDIAETVDKKIFTATEQTKLSGIENNATADQTAGEIKTAYESNANTNAYTDAEQTKVGYLTVTGAVDLDNINAATLDGKDLGEIFEKMRSKYIISGGGRIVWLSGSMSWSSRIIIIPVGQVTSTHFNIQPSSVTLGAWDVAYIRPSDADWNSGTFTNQTLNVASWTTYTPQFNDIVIAHRNGDAGNGQLVLMDGRFIDDGHVYNCSGERTQKGPVGIGTNAVDFDLQVGSNAVVNYYYNAAYKDSPLGIPLTFLHSWGVDGPVNAKANAYFYSNSSVASGSDMAGSVAFGGINPFGGYNTIYARMGGRRLGNFYGGFVFQTMHNLNDGALRIDMVIQDGKVGIGNSSPSNTLDVTGTVGITGSLSKGSGSFDIEHPDPEKKDTHRLRHYFVETPSAGGNIYKYQIDCKKGVNTMDLPTYFQFLNQDGLVWVNSYKHFGRGWGDIIDGGKKLEIHAEQDGLYNVLVFADRKDAVAMEEFNKYGIEYKK